MPKAKGRRSATPRKATTKVTSTRSAPDRAALSSPELDGEGADGSLEYLHARAHRGAKTKPAITALDREIFGLFGEARGLLYDARDDGFRAGDLTTKRERRDALRRIVLACRGIRDGLVDARVLFVDLILAASRLGSTAAAVADDVAFHYPALAEPMRDRARVARIALAIEAARSTKRIPWRLIVAAWAGIGATSKGHAESVWRVDYAKHCRARR